MGDKRGKTAVDEEAGAGAVVTAALANAADLEVELEWFAQVLDARLKRYFNTHDAPAPLEIPPPPLSGSDSPYCDFVRRHSLSPQERLTLLLALIPHVRPQLLDVLWSRNDATERGFTEFGGIHGNHHGGFIPTGETAAFVIAGDDLQTRFGVSALFDGDHLFARGRLLQLAPVAAGEPFFSGPLVMERDYLQLFTTGIRRKPNFNADFPARLIETELEWEHLILPHTTLEQLEEIRHWVLHSQTLLDGWGMRAKLPPGFTSLFHGPPGTGKTLAACLLGKYCGCDVYKIDLSMVVSKYIGETEKNLAKVFDMAESRNWILFFDEADSLFGKRSRVDDSHDRYANQEVSFLLQRMEDFHGVVILASNLKNNIDDAFLRRFHTAIPFPVPKAAERLRIWENAFSRKAKLEKRLDLAAVAERFEVTGGAIMNVVRYASLRALSRNQATILLHDVEDGIRKELVKEGKTV